MLKRRAMTVAAALLLGSTAAQADPAMWKVSDGETSIWLFGSVHLLRPDTVWRTPYLDKVLSKVDRVYFETDIGPEAQVRVTPLSVQLGFSRDGKLLSDKISPELMDELRGVAQDYGMQTAMLLTMEPWLAATTISMAPMTNSGFDPRLGVDALLEAELPAERKGYFETPEEQLAILAGGSLDEQLAMLRATLDSMSTMEADISELVDAWQMGNPDLLGELFMSQMGGYDDGMVKRLIDDRNHNWVGQIETMLKDKQSTLVVVGAAHLAGPVSVEKLLRDKGFTTERVQ